MLPAALKGVNPKVVASSGGVAGGVVTEGMGYALMIEGFLALTGDDKERALSNALGFTKSWLAMVNGPGSTVHPIGGGQNETRSATQADTWPYGISAVEWSHLKIGAAGVAPWKYPLNRTTIDSNIGSATDGDQDAILGMLYVAAALGFPEDFVDTVVRSIIAFASADLGFPDMYRTLPDGEVVYVPKLGSMWGGLTPPGGKYKTKQQPWCYSPGYFAPAHYRAFKDFLSTHWRPEFEEYMPRALDGSPTTLIGLLSAFDSAVTAGYNIMYHSSCEYGAVSNWVGVKAACSSDDQLNCPGVPWKHTPYVGEEGGQCSQSGTDFGAYGPDASRAAWRVAMDRVLHSQASSSVRKYNRDGNLESWESIGAQQYLNRILNAYTSLSECDGSYGSCFNKTASPWRLAAAFDPAYNKTDGTCANVPNPPTSWWAGFMSYPTFTAFVSPYGSMTDEEMGTWIDTFASICDFSEVNMWDARWGGKPKGKICETSYFESSQAVISFLILSGHLAPLPRPSGGGGGDGGSDADEVILKDASMEPLQFQRNVIRGGIALLTAAVSIVMAFVLMAWRRAPAKYSLLSSRAIEAGDRRLAPRSHR